MHIFIDIIRESYMLFTAMAPYLLFGFFFAGVLHIFVQEGVIAKHLGKNSIGSVIKAALFGIPLPLCSCGVLPAAVSLRKDGASKGAIVSFLITTPTTGLDSILATYALLGGVFTVFRVAASFMTGVVAGILTTLFVSNEKEEPAIADNKECTMCCNGSCTTKKHSMVEKIRSVFTYAFGTLIKDTGAWLLGGILIGGAISYFAPADIVTKYLGSPWISMTIMLLIGIPMYVCASGSIPIAAALMLKGMNPGAAFVFLLAGPAVNSVGLVVLMQHLGKKTVALMLFSIVICSFSLGFLLDFLWNYFNVDITKHMMAHHGMIPESVEVAASVFLLVAIFIQLIQRKKGGRI